MIVNLSGWPGVGKLTTARELAKLADFAVDRGARRQQVGRLLMDAAVTWVRDQGMRGIRLETQSNNLPAYRFYASYGFRLGGFDRLLYVAIDGIETKTALFWYLFLDSFGVPDRTDNS